jgi:multiple sugar transport system permease protein/raffinose/stachyose/melibiose transport system permease protein
MEATATRGTRQIWLRRLLHSGDWWRHAALIIITIFLFIPFIVSLIISFKDLNQFAVNPYGITFPLHWDNYAAAWDSVHTYILNSVIVSGTTVIGVVIVAALSAYVFARFEFPGKQLLFYLILSLIMIPGILTLVPSFVLVKNLGLLNTWGALILPFIAGGQVGAIFILRTFYEAMPEELFEAARIDGAGEVTIFARIAMPLSQSILGVVAVFNVLDTWNQFVWPLVVLQSDNLFTLALGLFSYRNLYYTAWGQLMAGYVIAAVPLIILFAFTSRLFVEGLAAGALKL